jgi:hypothetical protein
MKTCQNCEKKKTPLYELDGKAVCGRCYGEGYDDGSEPVVVGSMRIAQLERHRLVDKIKLHEQDMVSSRSDTSYDDADYSTGNSVEALMDKMRVRQKVLMAYQNGDVLEQRRYGNLLKRLQRHLLKSFEEGVDVFLATHNKEVNDTYELILALAEKYGVDTETIHGWPKRSAEDMDTANARDFMFEVGALKFRMSNDEWFKKMENILLYGSAGADRKREKEKILNHIKTIKPYLESDEYSPEQKENVKSIIRQQRDHLAQLEMADAQDSNPDPQVVIKDLMGYVESIKERVIVYDGVVKAKEYIKEARSSEDITDQIVAYEKVLNSVHNSGPLMEYVFFPNRNFHGRFVGEIKEFLDRLSNMKDFELNDSDKDYILQNASMRISKRDK